MTESAPDPVIVLMDLARYHYDEAEFYRKEMNMTDDETAMLMASLASVHKQAAEAARGAAQYVDGRRGLPKAVAGGRALRDSQSGVPWRDESQ